MAFKVVQRERVCRCNVHAAKLKRIKSKLPFKLHVQEFVALIQQDNVDAALQYARDQLVPFAEDYLPEFKTAVALLVFRKDTCCPRYCRLLHNDRWSELADLFLSELLRANSLPPVPLLELQLQARFLLAVCCQQVMHVHLQAHS